MTGVQTCALPIYISSVKGSAVAGRGEGTTGDLKVVSSILASASYVTSGSLSDSSYVSIFTTSLSS